MLFYKYDHVTDTQVIIEFSRQVNNNSFYEFLFVSLNVSDSNKYMKLDMANNVDKSFLIFERRILSNFITSVIMMCIFLFVSLVAFYTKLEIITVVILCTNIYEESKCRKRREAQTISKTS